MAVTFTQFQVDAAVAYLMTGGPGGGELTAQQYRDMVYLEHLKGNGVGRGGILSDFAWQIQLAINQGHAGIASSRNICRDKWGALADAWYMTNSGGLAQHEITNASVSISG